MKNVQKIINQLAQADIEVFVKNGQLKARAAKGQLSPKFIDIIKNNKTSLLKHLIGLDSIMQSQQRPEIKPLAHREKYLISSYAQQRLWFIDHMDGGSAHYNMSSAMQVFGDFDLNVANQAFTQIINRHETLRTHFKHHNDELYQYIQQDFEFNIVLYDIQKLSEVAQQNRCQQLMDADANNSFNLSKDLMLRVSFIKTADEEGYLLFNMHHIASDGWSITVLVKEFVELYQALIENRTPKLPTLDIQYVDYAHWQRQWLQGEVLESQLNYWQKKLADLPQVHDLPLDHERPSYQTFNGASHTFNIDAVVLSQLEKIALENKATLFMVVHAAFAILLSRYSNNQDIVIGTPVANRLQKELQGLIGFFANTLVLRADCRGELSFVEFLQQIKKTNVDAQTNQDVPFEHLVDKLNPERSTNYNALFQIMLSMNNNETSTVNLPGVSFSPKQGQGVVAKFDLMLNATTDSDQEDKGLYCSFVYNTDLFDQTTIIQLSDGLVRLFSAIAQETTQLIMQLPLISDDETNIQLHYFNNTDKSYPNEICIHQLFERQVEKAPNNIAVTFNDKSITYQELNNKANQLAHYLIDQGIRADTIVGICMHRSIDLVIAIIAVFKAGGAYLPLDPDYPLNRLEHMISNSGLTLIITQEHLIKLTKSMGDQLIIDNELFMAKYASGLSENPVISDLTSQHLAYVIYTSGSTGLPKGVMVEHQALVNRIDWMQNEYQLTEKDVVLQKTPYSFDVSVWEFTWFFTVGAQLLIAEPDGHKDPRYLIDLIKQNQVTTMHFVPSMFRMILAYKGWSQCDSLRQVFCSGEALPADLPKMHYELNSARIHNLYGPTEAAIDVSYWSVPDEHALANIPIGKPIQNIQLLILNEQMQIQPKGSPGELFIGGVGLARGYLNQPDLTAERFINNPFTAINSDRLYRTGDVVRYLDNGDIEFIGRVDHQVKLRGLRIELTEIDYQLSRLPQIDASLTMVKQSQVNHHYLISYFTSVVVFDEKTLIKQIKSAIQQNLPDYMVPSIYVRLDEFPLTSNGKIDRKALPDPEVLAAEYVAPQGQLEKELSVIWSQLLHVNPDKISRNANFFELGGHSLLSVRLISEIRNTFDCELSVRNIFDTPELSQIAEKITKSEAANRPKIMRITREKNQLTCSYAQQRLWFIDQIGGGSVHYNMPSAMRVKGDFNLIVAQQSFQQIIKRHETLRTVFVDSDHGPLQIIKDNTDFKITFIDLSSVDKVSQEDKIQLAIANDAKAPFDLKKDVMLRVSYLRLSVDEGVLLFNMHHIASDGWSTGVLVNEFAQLYRANLKGKSCPLQTLSIQYADYAHWQKEWSKGDVFDAQLQYWDEKLADLPQVHGLPLCNKRPSTQTFNGASIQFDLGKKEWFRLKDIALNHKITLFMLLHGAFSLLLSRYSDSNDIVVGTPVANRLQKQLDQLIGFFVNTLILRIDCSNNPTLIDFLKQVKNTNLDAQANQDVPFEHLVDRLNPVRSTSHSALIQILFSMNTNEVQSLSLPDVKLSPEHYSNQSTKFELILNAIEHDEGLVFDFKYNRDIFNASFISSLGKSFLLLLKNIMLNSNGHIADLEIFDDKQRNHLLYTLNETRVSYKNEMCIHQMFENTVINKPNKMALVFEDQSLTYLELNQKANQLAHYLMAKGITVNANVGLYSKRSVNMIVAMIAILKCGAAYLPLDTNQPIQRLNFILSDSGIDYIVSDLLVSKLTLDDINVVNMNDTHHIKQYSCDNPEVNNSVSQLAYIIYTSGSTGLPKGVMVEHKNVMAYYLSLQQQWQLLDGDNVTPWLWNASYAFDASVKGLLSLFTGRGLVMPNDSQAQNPRALVTLIQKNQVGIYNASPHLMEIVLSRLTEQKTAHLPHLIISGEQIPREIFNKVVNYCRCNNRKAINAYGPTETTINSTFGLISNSLNIGHPIANTQVYILDHNRNLVPYGSVGELYIGGEGLSRGYLNHPDLTIKRFIDHEFSDGYRTKLYRSGDLAQYQQDGKLSYMGRIDDQVKLRGFRIELGEIEHHLATIDGITSTRVMICKDQAGQKQLVAYLILDKRENNFGKDEINDIKRQLRQSLPDYMVPNFYMILDEFPITSNGKINFKALPKPERTLGNYVAPVTEIEQKLVTICSDLLNIDKKLISMDASFFELGGHSLLSMRLLSEIRNAFDCELSIKTVFETPHLSELAKKIELSGVTARPRITKVSRDTNKLITSYAQQRLWFIDQVEGGSAHYNMPTAIRVEGDFNIKIAHQSLQQIIDRHETLRTVFIDGKDGPMQVINDDVEFKINKIDLTDKNKVNQDITVEHAIKEDSQLPFNIRKDLMLRVSYLHLCSDKGILLFNMHHIASDGWSMGILVSEFAQLYCANLEGKHNPLTPLSIQYADYTYWQRQWLQGEFLESQLSYWDHQLVDLPQVHEFPLDHDRPIYQTFNGATHSFYMNEDILNGLEHIAKENKATLFMVIHAAFAILLSRYSNNKDIVIGTPVANRLQKELEVLIGFFVNTLVLRADCDGELSFIEFLEQIKHTNIEAQANQDVPFEHLVDRLNPQRSTSHNALFQVMLSMNNNERPIQELPKIKFSMQKGQDVVAKFDLVLSVTPVNGNDEKKGLFCSIVYNTDLFKPSTIENLSDSLERLFLSIIKDTSQLISHLSLLGKQDKQYLLENLNNTKTSFPDELCIHQLFEQQVEKAPNNVALFYEKQSLTYKELNEKANQLAHYLIAQGVKPDDMIGICVERSIEMMVVVLAILKAGAAYLPLDPDYPQGRLDHIISDSDLSLVITQHDLTEITQYQKVQQIVIDHPQLTNILSGFGPENPYVDYLASNHLAYVIYTSGSTGLPKGVMIEHKGVINLACFLKQYFVTKYHSKILQFASLNFDAATWEWILALSHGASLYICEQSVRYSPDKLADYLESHKITHLALPPAVLQYLDIGRDYVFESLVVAGEACDESLSHKWGSKYALFNGYGPTEATVAATVSSPIINQKINIGKAINNTELFVLGDNQQLLPLGSTGELYIGGVGLARGYINQEQLTRQRFMKISIEGERKRLYRTGDLVRYKDDGNLVFMGRVDDQIKIRGFRVELGEIEQQLKKHSNVESSLVTVSHEQKMIAYIIVDTVQDEPDFIKDVRLFLKNHLPDYMIPSAFVILDAFPLTVNGKIDRKVLPDPEFLESEYTAPQGKLENELSRIWSELLHIDQEKISRSSSFFELGGHSLLSVRLLSEIRNTFDCELSIKAVFETPHLSDLANQIELSEATQRPKITKITRDTNKLVPSYAQQRLWFIDQMEGGSAHYNMPSAMRVKGDFNIKIAQKSFQQIIDRHETLRTVFIDGEDGPLQVITDEAKFQITQIDLADKINDDRDQLIKKAVSKDAQSPFDLRQDLMLRVSYLSLSENEGVLLFNMHHIASDGWSMGLLVNEFTQLYRANIEGVDHGLHSLSIQYADYAYWQRHWLAGEVFESQLSYWSQQLADLPQVHGLPLDHERPIYQTFNGASYPFHIGGDVLTQLEALATKNKASLFMVIHAVFAILLSRYSNNSDIVIGTPVANRLEKELENLIGLFVNTLVLRTDCNGELTFESFLQQVKETNLGAQSNQDTSFEILVDKLKPERSTSHHALFQVMLNVNNNETSIMELPDVIVSPIGRNKTIAKFDLELNAVVTNSGNCNNNLSCSFVYNTDLFNHNTIERFSASLQRLFKGVAENSTLKIADLPLLGRKETQFLLNYNNVCELRTQGLSIHQLFEQQANKNPDNIAIVFENNHLSYLQLNEKANRLAYYLIAEHNVNVGDIIGICMHRSIEMIVGLIAILKTGAAYLPLDPLYPKERINFIVKHSGLALVLTQNGVTASSSELCVFVDDQEALEILKTHDKSNPVVQRLSPEELAYVIYTSGSTGQPKGVMIQHSAVVNFIIGMQVHLKDVLHTSTKWLAVTTVSFDIAVLEIFGPLSFGGRVILASKDDVINPERLFNLLDTYKISCMQATPATWQMMVDNGWQGQSGLTILSGGEVLPVSLAHSLIDVNEKLWNCYGPTEATVWSLVKPIKKASLIDQKVKIGHSLPNYNHLILNHRGELTPKGVVGELYIGGAGLAKGYINDPDLTAQRFIMNPVNKESQDLLYRTGDLVRCLDYGSFEYIGRTDHQVKIRGYRIELGEIEQQLLKHNAINNAVVTVYTGTGNQHNLVVYFTSNESDDTKLSDDIRSKLQKHLPDYMVPSMYICLSEIPVTPNGKIDRKALPDPEISEVDYVAPHGDLEIELSKIWSKLLHIDKEKVSREANFFELGGHSLLLLPLINQLKERGINCSIKAFYEHQTLAGICQAFKTTYTSHEQTLVKLNDCIAGIPLFIVHPLNGRVDCYANLAKQLPVPVFGIQAPFYTEHFLPFEDIKTLANFYADAIIYQQKQGPYRLAGWSAGGLIAQHIAHVLNDRGLKVEYFVGIDSFMIQPFKQQKCRYEALKQVMGTIELASDLSEDILDPDLVEHSYDEQLNIIYDAIDFSDSGMSQLQIIQGFKFRVDFFMAAINLQPQFITDRSRLFIAEKNTKQSLLLDGWQKAINCQNDSYEYIDGDHESLLIGENLQRIINILIKDIEQLAS